VDHGPFYALDIETETTGDDPAVGLDPSRSRVTAVAIVGADREWLFDDGDERVLLGRVASWASDPTVEPGVIVTWNGAKFDWPFLAARAETTGTELPLRLAEDPTVGGLWPSPGWTAQLGPHGHTDIMRDWKAYADEHGIGCSLKAVAQQNGIGMVVVDRERMHELDPAELRDYVLSDARGTLALAERMDRWRCDPWPLVPPGTDPLTGAGVPSGLSITSATLDVHQASGRWQDFRCGRPRSDGNPCRQRVRAKGATCSHHATT